MQEIQSIQKGIDVCNSVCIHITEMALLTHVFMQQILLAYIHFF